MRIFSVNYSPSGKISMIIIFLSRFSVIKPNILHRSKAYLRRCERHCWTQLPAPQNADDSLMREGVEEEAGAMGTRSSSVPENVRRRQLSRVEAGEVGGL